MPSTGHESWPEGGEEHGAPPEPRSKEAWDFWERIGGPTKVAAPMVRCSELAWRLLVRTHGAQLCYTPMISARAFLAMSIKEREDFIEPHAHDRPLFLQFCTNSPEEFAEVAVAAQGYGDAIDLNLGCPVDIGRNYGAILAERDTALCCSIIAEAATCPDVHVPITCKIRVFDDVVRTVDFARRLQRSGVSCLCVHGRTRAQGGRGDSDWSKIAAVKEALGIPVIANGGFVREMSDVDRCLSITRADALMSAVGLLLDHRMFSGCEPRMKDGSGGTSPCAGGGCYDHLDLAYEYCQAATAHATTPGSCVREHLKLLLRPVACPTRFKHSSGTDQHQDVWSMMEDKNIETAQQGCMLVLTLAWRTSHTRLWPLVTNNPPPTLKEIKTMDFPGGALGGSGGGEGGDDCAAFDGFDLWD